MTIDEYSPVEPVVQPDGDRPLHVGMLATVSRPPVANGHPGLSRVAMIRADADGYAAAMPPSSPDLPRFPLTGGPSPLAPLVRLSATLGGRAELWIKREDLLPLAFGGNKLRNLETLVGAALAAGADCLVTAGRRWSNHCRLTAAAGAIAGLDVHLVLSGPPADRPIPADGSTSCSGRRSTRPRPPTGPSAKALAGQSSPRSATRVDARSSSMSEAVG